MSSQSIWKAATGVTVSVYFSSTDNFTTDAYDGLIWSGSLALGGSSTFACTKSVPVCNLTVSVDANGVVSLTSDVSVSGASGNHFLVSVTPAGVNLPECEWANTVSHGNFSALYVDSVAAPYNAGVWPNPETVPSSIGSWFGYAGGWSGF